MYEKGWVYCWAFRKYLICAMIYMVNTKDPCFLYVHEVFFVCSRGYQTHLDRPISNKDHT